MEALVEGVSARGNLRVEVEDEEKKKMFHSIFRHPTSDESSPLVNTIGFQCFPFYLDENIMYNLHHHQPTAHKAHHPNTPTPKPRHRPADPPSHS